VKDPSWTGSDVELVAALQQHVQDRLARYKQPRCYEFIDVLPRNPSGKILKRVLREPVPGARAE